MSVGFPPQLARSGSARQRGRSTVCVEHRIEPPRRGRARRHQLAKSGHRRGDGLVSIGGCAVEQLVPEDRPSSGDGVAPGSGHEHPGHGGDGAGPTDQPRLHGRGDPVVRQMVGRQCGPVARRGTTGLAQQCLRRGATAAHGLGDPLALQRIHETGGVADEEHTPQSRSGAEYTHLEPTSEASRINRPPTTGQESDLPDVSQEARELLLNPRSRSPIPHRPQTQTHVRPSSGPGEDPSVPRKGPPGGRLPQDDGRDVDDFGDVCPDGEPPQHPPRIDQLRIRCYPARGAIRSDHKISAQIVARAQPIPVDPALPLERLHGTPMERNSTRVNRGIVQERVEDRPRHRRAMVGVGEPLAARQQRSTTGRADDRDLADVTTDRRG